MSPHDHDHDHDHHDHGSHHASHAHHDHHDHHHHVPAADAKSSAFVIGIGLNLGFVVVEAVYGVLSQSLALVADAGHNLGDVLGLVLAWGAIRLASRKPSLRRTYGLRRATILAAGINSATLLFVIGGLAWEAVRRLMSPTPVAGKTVIVVALAGVLVNGASAMLFARGREHDLNVRGAFLHLAADAGLSLGVAIGGLVILGTGWVWVDPVVTIVVALVILAGTMSLMRRSFDLMLDAVPEGIDPERVKAYLAALPGVVEVHDLHIWAMSTTETALTAHLVMPAGVRSPSFLADACHDLQEQFRIAHSTLQIDAAEATVPCRLAPDEVV
jgi:cobalt-zinc-cadmium efflux system protein